MKPADFWKSFEVEIKGFDQLVKTIDQIMEKAVKKKIQFAWRGQVDSNWALHSSLYRRLSLTKGRIVIESELSDAESEILINLHRWGLHHHPNRGRLSILNQLAILQHYGTPTRLIDITFNAWVGVFFAVEQKWNNGKEVYFDSDARLFAFDVTNKIINEDEDKRPWEDSKNRPWKDGRLDQDLWTTSTFAWKPPSIDPRIFAQNGAFLIGGVPASNKPNGAKLQFPKEPGVNTRWKIDEVRASTSVALRPHVFDPKHGGVNDGALYTFRIHAKAKADIRERLKQMFGYDHSTIYPDYSGFSLFGTPTLKSTP
jgi:hypothetical protein